MMMRQQRLLGIQQQKKGEIREEQKIDEYCQICYVKYSKRRDELFRPAMICYQCWYEHVRTNVTKISYLVGSNVISPFQGGNDIDICIALNGLNDNHKKQLQDWLFKKYTTFTKDVQKCPSQTCDYVFTMQKCKWMANQQHKCPKCQVSLSVSQTMTLKSVLGFIYFIFLANKCPKCQIPIQKISGCPHMTCPCGHQFCWFCLKDHVFKQDNLYSVHQPKECVFIFFSKIIILGLCLLSLSCFLVGGQTIRYLMDQFFNILGYLIHLLVVDFCLSVQWLAFNAVRTKALFQSKSFRTIKIVAFITVNLVFIAILIALELLYTTLVILFIQVTVFGIGYLVVLGVIFSCSTWFQYIA